MNYLTKKAEKKKKTWCKIHVANALLLKVFAQHPIVKRNNAWYPSTSTENSDVRYVKSAPRRNVERAGSGAGSAAMKQGRQNVTYARENSLNEADVNIFERENEGKSQYDDKLTYI